MLINTAYSQNTSHGAFGALEFKSLGYKNQAAVFTGGRFGWVINNKYIIGAGYYSLATSLKLNYESAPKAAFDNFNYGGLEFEYTFLDLKPCYASFALLLGGGGITIFMPNVSPGNDIRTTLNLLVYEPRICFEYSIFNWLNTSIGFSYRFVANLDGAYGIMNNDVSGFTGSISFRFGDYR